MAVKVFDRTSAFLEEVGRQALLPDGDGRVVRVLMSTALGAFGDKPPGSILRRETDAPGGLRIALAHGRLATDQDVLMGEHFIDGCRNWAIDDGAAEQPNEDNSRFVYVVFACPGLQRPTSSNQEAYVQTIAHEFGQDNNTHIVVVTRSSGVRMYQRILEEARVGHGHIIDIQEMMVGIWFGQMTVQIRRWHDGGG